VGSVQHVFQRAPETPTRLVYVELTIADGTN